MVPWSTHAYRLEQEAVTAARTPPVQAWLSVVNAVRSVLSSPLFMMADVKPTSTNANISFQSPECLSGRDGGRLQAGSLSIRITSVIVLQTSQRRRQSLRNSGGKTGSWFD